MTDDFDAENAKSVIYDDNINVTKLNPLKDLFQMALKVALIVVGIYLFIFVTSGIILQNIPFDKRVVLEDLISPNKKFNTIKLPEKERAKLERIKHNILKIDKNFPRASSFQINVIDNKHLNALCYPNGDVYITLPLYNKIKSSDEELTFVIAHEMAHYKHKDHLYNLRRSISSGITIILLSVVSPNSEQIGKIAESGFDVTDLKFSRGAEKRADMYAIKVMNALYGNANAGISVMNKLKDGNDFDVEFLSTHPNLDKRIKYIKKLSK